MCRESEKENRSAARIYNPFHFSAKNIPPLTIMKATYMKMGTRYQLCFVDAKESIRDSGVTKQIEAEPSCVALVL